LFYFHLWIQNTSTIFTVIHPILMSPFYFHVLFPSKFHMWEKNIWYLLLWYWLTSLNMMISSSTHFLTDNIIHSLCLNSAPLKIHITFSLSIHLLMGLT
jgi:hypothetical protein